jgi:hypothetical protein
MRHPCLSNAGHAKIGAHLDAFLRPGPAVESLIRQFYYVRGGYRNVLSILDCDIMDNY